MQINDKEQKSERNKKEKEQLTLLYSTAKLRRADLINSIEDKVKECNDQINKENEVLTNLRNSSELVSLLKKQHEELQSLSTSSITLMNAYKDFQENNKKSIAAINRYFEDKWKQFESKWWKWDVIDIISWFKYKTIGKDTGNLNWKSIKNEMTKRNIDGKSLEHFNDSRLDMIGIKDFNISVFLMKEIATLRTKYDYMFIKDDTKDNDNDDDIDNNQEIKIPSRFLCPLTKEIMKDPVIAFDENTYEREAIENHLKQNRISPITGNKAYIMNVYPNQELKKEIEAFCVVHDIDTHRSDIEGYTTNN